MLDGIHTAAGHSFYYALGAGAANSNGAQGSGLPAAPIDAKERTKAEAGVEHTHVQSSERDAAAEKRKSARIDYGGDQELTREEQALLRKLKARDAEVRAHEAAHQAAAGALATGGTAYQYQRGPDGKNYAVGGHVSINTSKGRTPEDTLQRAQQIRAAALAPAAPSSQDLKVAAAASKMAMEAQRELQKERAEALDGMTSAAVEGASQAVTRARSAPHANTTEMADSPQRSAHFSGKTLADRRTHMEETNEQGVLHGSNQAHLQQCPECMQKFFRGQEYATSSKALFA